MRLLCFSLFLLVFVACQTNTPPDSPAGPISPDVVTQPTPNDTDDPAVWINRANPAESLILGTDKETDGGLYVFDLSGKIVAEKSIIPLRRPNNVDVEYGFRYLDTLIDIAVVTEREAQMLRVFRVPNMQAIDGGGIPIFQREEGEMALPMGIALYKKPASEEIHAIVSRKFGPTDSTYLWQYRLTAKADSTVGAELIRKFGAFGGQEEIEAIAVDDTLGYVYYSDEMVGIRKYHADPAMGNAELALFGTEGFTEDREGIALWPTGAGEGYLVVSDQQAGAFRVFTRTGTPEQPHQHEFVTSIPLSTQETDGVEISTVPFTQQFPKGFFIAMSEDKTFQVYDLRKLMEAMK